MSREDKRRKVMGNKKGSSTKLFVLIAVAVVLIGGVAFALTQNSTPGNSVEGTRITDGANYEGQVVRATGVTPEVTGEKLIVDLDDVKANKIVEFEDTSLQTTLRNGQTINLPLMAYIAPSGKLVVAVRVCEPCSGTSFRIEGDQLVCNACETRWDLETLQGISGGCPDYPPESFKYELNGNKITIDQADLKAWQPRP